MNIKVLSRSDLEQVLDVKSVFNAVEKALICKAQGQMVAWPPISYRFDTKSDLDIRSGGTFGEVGVHGVNVINSFPDNAKQNLPSYSGVLMTFDSNTGLPTGVLDASYITCMRAGAAGALSAKALSRAGARTILIVGAGRQAFFQLGALLSALPHIKNVLICNPSNPERASSFVENAPAQLADQFGLWTTNITFTAVGDLESAVAKADVIATTTPSREPLIQRDWVKPGTHIICVGANAPGKEELDPLLLQGTRVFCDDIKQCTEFGEMEIPFKTGIFRQADFAGELGQVLSGSIPGRTNDEEITIFDTVGLAGIDLAIAQVAIESASRRNKGITAPL